MTEVILEYRREVDKSTGRILVSEAEGDGPPAVGTAFFEFQHIEFEPMLTKLAQALQENPTAAAVIQRTDRAGLMPYYLDERTLTLFRTDPVAAIRAMAQPFGSPSVAVKRVKEERTPTLMGGLRAGHGTLADAFGDELYARFDKARGKVECPCCGIWAGIQGGESFLLCANPACAAYNRVLAFDRQAEKWATFRTFALLALNSPRYYFPRQWNEGSWISREDLNEKYSQFQKEKQSCR